MSVAVINRNPDLKRLQDEGYELEVREGCAIVWNVPYLDHNLTVQRGVLVSPLNMIGDAVKYVSTGTSHVIYFQGTMPYRANGTSLESVMLHQHTGNIFAGVHVDMSFSNKPIGGYTDYHHKFTRYIEILSAEARAVEPTATAATFRRIVTDEIDSVFYYEDTNASRAAIMDTTDKFKGLRIGIVGMGGTGSYILDQVAKIPVAEIHLFDGDIFQQHNAFRAPGAPTKESLINQLYKSDYFQGIYGNMHRHIVSHPQFLDACNVSQLNGLDFVFLSMDAGPAKKVIIDHLCAQCIGFIDTGIDVQRSPNGLLGTVRVTLCVDGVREAIDQHVSFAQAEQDLYQSNIQVSDLNALCGLLAVMRWKQRMGFYADHKAAQNLVYNTFSGEFT